MAPGRGGYTLSENSHTPFYFGGYRLADIMYANAIFSYGEFPD